MVCSVCEAAGWLVAGPAGGAAADAAVLLHLQPARCLRPRGLCHSAASIEYCCWGFAWVHRGLWLALMAGGAAWQRRLAIAAGAACTALTSVAESSHCLGHQTGELICPPEHAPLQQAWPGLQPLAPATAASCNYALLMLRQPKLAASSTGNTCHCCSCSFWCAAVPAAGIFLRFESQSMLHCVGPYVTSTIISASASQPSVCCTLMHATTVFNCVPATPPGILQLLPRASCLRCLCAILHACFYADPWPLPIERCPCCIC